MKPRKPHSVLDLADAVHRLRACGRRAALGPAGIPAAFSMVWFGTPENIQACVEALVRRSTEAGPELRVECADLVEEFLALEAALESGIAPPSSDDLIARFVGGEIGALTAVYVSGWSHPRLRRECERRGFVYSEIVDIDAEFADVYSNGSED